MAADPVEELPDDQSARLFGWSSVKRRMAQPDEKPGEPDAPKRAPGSEPPLRLRPSGQLSPIRRWGYGEDAKGAAREGAGESPPPPPPVNRVAPPERVDRVEREQQQQRPPAPRTDEAVPGLPPVRKHYDSVTPGGAGRLTNSMRGNPQAEAAKIRLHEMLIDELEHGVLEGLAPEAQREAVSRAARELIAQENMPLGGVSKDELALAVADEVLGLGPLEPLLRDPAVSEVMVNDVDKIFYEQDGKIFRSAARFRDVPHMMRIIERIVAPLGRRIDESSPMVDARLMDGSRVNITIPRSRRRRPASPSESSAPTK